LDGTGAITQWNAAAERLLAVPARAVYGRLPVELGLGAGVTANSPTDLEVARRDGSTVPVRVFVAALPEPAGGRVLLLQDLTAPLQAEAAQRQVQKLDAIARLAGGVAQEFNNILTAVLGHATLLAEAMPAVDERREHADEVRRAAERAAGLTRQLLVISGQYVARPALLDLSALLREMRPAIDGIASDRIHLELNLAPEPWPVLCDPGQLQQLVVNLLVNARDAMADGGRLEIATRNVAVDAADAAEGMPAGEHVLLRVADTGAGMDRGTLERLFEPFFTTKRDAAGLGLVTVFATVRKYGAHIRVDSQPGRGTAFDIYWPRASSRVRSAPGAAPADGVFGTILVVEDDEAVRELAARVLRRAGHRVLVAASGEEALAEAERGTGFDLLVADIVMPGMSGTELAERLRRQRPDLPILFTSGNAAGAFQDATELLRDSSFMEKPYDPAALAARVRELLPVRD
jgi:two-component system, cell cycle sensor histidine kinase and response regulator CckA